MSAEVGNEYWKFRSVSGRQKLFESPDHFLNEANKYFEYCDNNTKWVKKDFIRSGELAGQIIDLEIPTPYTIEGLCTFLGITYQTFLNYESLESHKEFFEVFTYVRQKIKNQQLSGATSGIFNANIVSRINGLTEKVDHTSNGKELKQITGIIFEQKPDNNE